MRRMLSRLLWTRVVRGCAGNVSILFALSSVAVMLAIGMAVDYAKAGATHRQMQNAVDAGVLAGAKAAASSDQSAALKLANQVFAGHFARADASATFAFNSDGSLSGSASYAMPTLFAGFTGAAILDLGVRAKAISAGAPVCILLTAPNLSQSLLANSGATIKAPNCEIDVASAANPGAIFNAGVTINAAKTCLKSATTINNGGAVSNLKLGCATAANPFVGALPAPASTTCAGATANGGNYSGAVALSPGVYCGWFNFNGATTVTLKPGVYVIKNGGWNVNGGAWSGAGVTFYFADSSRIQFNSGMSLTLNAPTTGTYAGILFYEPDGLANSQFVFNDSVSETFSGLIYLPSRSVTFNSTSNLTTPNLTLVAYSAIFNTLNWSLTPNSLRPITTSGGGAPRLVM